MILSIKQHSKTILNIW